jgi:glycosyltransferase involved in cell wall biosynthesis
MSSPLDPADLRRSAVLRRGAYLAPRIAEVIDAARPDLVYAHWGPNAVAAALATNRSHVPVIADLHGYDLTRVPRQEGWRAYAVSLADCALVVHSEFGRQLVSDHLGRDPIVCRFGIDPVFAPPARAETWPRPLRVLTVGRLVAEKGHDTALGALAFVRRRRPELDVRLTIVGAGPADEALRRSARELGVDDAVDFLGPLPRAGVAQQMRDSDILVVASRPAPDGWMELFGRVAAEGLCSGLAVIATPHGGLAEVVGDAGLIVDRDGPVAVAEAIEALVDRERPIDIAAIARRRAAVFALAENWAMDDRIARQLAGAGA